MLSAKESLKRLRDGNQRFVSNSRDLAALTSANRRGELASGQEPFVIILGCSDSRVPAEFVFDLGLGDTFVIRVAGNIVAPSQVGSVEFAAKAFGTRLVVVLGHSSCGAISATVDARTAPKEEKLSPNLRYIVDSISPSIEELFHMKPPLEPKALIHHAVRANIRASANHLRHGSRVLEQLIHEDGLRVVGAEYCLETGEVDFFDGADEV